jgi:hypothetical protein
MADSYLLPAENAIDDTETSAGIVVVQKERGFICIYLLPVVTTAKNTIFRDLKGKILHTIR